MNSFRKLQKQNVSLRTNVDQCNTAERLTIWAIRLWSAGQRKNANIFSHIVEGFRQHGTVQGATNIILLLDTIVAGLNRNIEINCGCYVYIGDDERKILEVLKICQNQSHADISSKLSDFLNPAAIQLSTPLFHDLANALMSASLFLSDEWILNEDEKVLIHTDENYSSSIH